MTKRMKEAGELIGIFVKDHIIIGGRTGEVIVLGNMS